MKMIAWSKLISAGTICSNRIAQPAVRVSVPHQVPRVYFSAGGSETIVAKNKGGSGGKSSKGNKGGDRGGAGKGKGPGNAGGWPSTTGKPSGGFRSNNSPK